MKRYTVQDNSGNTWHGNAKDRDDAQQLAIDYWELAGIVFGDIVVLRGLADNELAPGIFAGDYTRVEFEPDVDAFGDAPSAL